MSTPSSRMRRAKTRDTRGYTAVEVLVAMTLFAIGAAGVISMQRTAIQANSDARQLDIANQIARDWIGRLNRDAALWTTPSGTNATENFANAKLLSTYVGADTSATWSFPDVLVADGVSPAFDIFGRDLPAASYATAFFCTQIRLDWLIPRVVGVPGGLMRAEVRVFWPRGAGTAGAAGCVTQTFTDAASATANQMFHFVYATTAIRQNGLQ